MNLLGSLRSKTAQKLFLDPMHATLTHHDVLVGYVHELRHNWPGQDSHRRCVLHALEQAADQFDAELGARLRHNRVSEIRKLSAECSYQFALLESF